MGVGSEGQSPPTRFSSPLGAWGPRVAAASPELHQSDGGGVWLHAPGLLSPPSGPSTLQGPRVRAAQEVSQPGEALGRTNRAPALLPGGTAPAGEEGGGSSPSLGTSGEPIKADSQHVRSLLANQPNAPELRGLAPPSSPMASGGSQVPGTCSATVPSPIADPLPGMPFSASLRELSSTCLSDLRLLHGLA